LYDMKIKLELYSENVKLQIAHIIILGHTRNAKSTKISFPEADFI